MTAPNLDFTFAESAGRGAPSARIIWHEKFDQSILHVDAVPSNRTELDLFDLARFFPLCVIALGARGREHVVISNGSRRIRIDVEQGSLRHGPVLLRHKLAGVSRLDPQLLTLRRLIILHRTGRFGASLFPADPIAPRIVAALRVHDGLCTGATHRDLAIGLFGYARVVVDWAGASDSMKLRVRRLVAASRHFAGGGWRALLR